jgi:hypothetical protein
MSNASPFLDRDVINGAGILVLVIGFLLGFYLLNKKKKQTNE